MDNKIKQYCKDVAEEFIKKYTNEIDKNIDKILKYIGFEGDRKNAGKFLEDNGYQLLFDDEQLEKYSNKVIYLTKDKEIKACFAIKILYGDNLSYEVSDIYVKDDWS